MAVFKVGDRSPEVATIQADILMMHGVDDGLIPPAHGEHRAELIKGSKYVPLEGMGHNLPIGVLPDLIANMTGHISTVEAAKAGF
jgi:pimeloyl-ACP methyl ester carboxylesterase